MNEIEVNDPLIFCEKSITLGTF